MSRVIQCVYTGMHYVLCVGEICQPKLLAKNEGLVTVKYFANLSWFCQMICTEWEESWKLKALSAQIQKKEFSVGLDKTFS